MECLKTRLQKRQGSPSLLCSYVENGCKQPKFETLQSVCQGLGISVFELLAYNEIASMTEKLKTENLVVQPEHGKAEEDIGQSLYEGFLIKQQ